MVFLPVSTASAMCQLPGHHRRNRFNDIVCLRRWLGLLKHSNKHPHTNRDSRRCCTRAMFDQSLGQPYRSLSSECVIFLPIDICDIPQYSVVHAQVPYIFDSIAVLRYVSSVSTSWLSIPVINLNKSRTSMPQRHIEMSQDI
jgi:hypothetical protein